MSNHYKTLGLEPTASSDEVTQAFRKMALKYHPDRNDSPDATLRFQEVYEAYEVLKNVAKRPEQGPAHLLYDFLKTDSQRKRERHMTRETLEDLQASEMFERTVLNVNDLLQDLQDMGGRLKERQKDLKKAVKNAKLTEQQLREQMLKMAEEIRDETKTN